MLEAVFSAVFFLVLFLVVLAGFLIFIFRDAIYWGFEFVGWVLSATFSGTVRLTIQGMEILEYWLGGIEILHNPAMRALVMGLVAIPVTLGLLVFISMILQQPWVLVTVAATVGFFLLVGVLADPDNDWAPPSFPDLPRRGGGGWKLPLNL